MIRIRGRATDLFGLGAWPRLAVVELIGATTTKTGLKVESALDTRSYYTIKPRHPAES